MPNLNPAHLAKLKIGRPQSASLRTPRGGDQSFSRLRSEGQATPRLPPAAPETDPANEEPWLFSFTRCLTTNDVWKVRARTRAARSHWHHAVHFRAQPRADAPPPRGRPPQMGFSRTIIFGAHHWSDPTIVAAEMSEAFRCERPIAGLGAEHKGALEAAIAPSFLRGDVLIAINCFSIDALPAAEAKACHDHVAKLIDAVSNVWCQYNEMADDELGAVVIVVEGFEGISLTPDWDDLEEAISYPLTPLDEELTAFFK